MHALTATPSDLDLNLNNNDLARRPVVWQAKGRWVAISAPGSRFRIGVFGQNRNDAEDRYVASVRRWAAWATTPAPTANERCVCGGPL